MMKCYLMAKSLWEYIDPDPNTGNTTMTTENGDFFRKAHAALILHLEDRCNESEGDLVARLL
jgi:hypothetical protein